MQKTQITNNNKNCCVVLYLFGMIFNIHHGCFLPNFVLLVEKCWTFFFTFFTDQCFCCVSQCPNACTSGLTGYTGLPGMKVHFSYYFNCFQSIQTLSITRCSHVLHLHLFWCFVFRATKVSKVNQVNQVGKVIRWKSFFRLFLGHWGTRVTYVFVWSERVIQMVPFVKPRHYFHYLFNVIVFKGN